jgi:glutamine amidotransferase
VTTIALVDYGAGNLTSVINGLRASGAAVVVATRPSGIPGADGVLVPGVGHFRQTAVLDDGWRDAVREALADGRPLLGICLGMQWLFEGSEEAPEVPGLGLLPGRATRLSPRDPALKVPHVGWNSLDATARPSRLLEGLGDPAYGYFAHTYAIPLVEEAVATTDHGERFTSVVERGRVFGMQCHPEKSGRAGLAMLRHFVSIAADAGCCRGASC